ncbi:MAG: hypothetical protein KF842_15710 [Caulobacter sp.]|nr:hypothetical protein [Caulobacter sp.]
MAFSREGELARLAYRLGGEVRYFLTCKEGSDRAILALQPAPSPKWPVALEAGRNDGEVKLRVRPQRDGTFHFHLQDSFLSRFLWAGGMGARGKWMPVVPDGSSADARWRFSATCASVPADMAAIGEAPPRSLYDLMSGLNVESAEADARRAMARGDDRFVTVTGFSRTAPGVPGNRVPDGHAFRDIDLTYDVIRSQEQGALKARARRYAQAYNAVVLSGRTDDR